MSNFPIERMYLLEKNTKFSRKSVVESIERLRSELDVRINQANKKRKDNPSQYEDIDRYIDDLNRSKDVIDDLFEWTKGELDETSFANVMIRFQKLVKEDKIIPSVPKSLKKILEISEKTRKTVSGITEFITKKGGKISKFFSKKKPNYKKCLEVFFEIQKKWDQGQLDKSKYFDLVEKFKTNGIEFGKELTSLQQFSQNPEPLKKLEKIWESFMELSSNAIEFAIKPGIERKGTLIQKAFETCTKDAIKLAGQLKKIASNLLRLQQFGLHFCGRKR